MRVPAFLDRLRPATTATARRTGGAYLGIVGAGLFAEFFVRMSIVAPDDPAATAQAIADSQALFISGIGADVAMIALDVAVGIGLFCLLRHVDERLAVIATVARFVQAAVLTVNLVNPVRALGFARAAADGTTGAGTRSQPEPRGGVTGASTPTGTRQIRSDRRSTRPTITSHQRTAPRQEITMETLAARGVTTLLGLVALVQLAVALGAPLGAHVYGGRAASAGGTLPPTYRAASLVTVGVLVAAGWLVLARAGIVTTPARDSTLAVWGTWALGAFLALNTLANLASTSPWERWGFGAVTAVAAVLSVIVARS